MVYRLLISSPGDVLRDDLAIVRNTINRWNGVYGPQMGGIVLPISWGTHAAAEFGRHPQAILNEQIVDDCDICIALFANRLGTATDVAESGTVEEIDRISAAGRYVAALRCRRSVDMAGVDLTQAMRLDDYMKSIRGSALVFDYRDDAELQSNVEMVLNAAIAKARGRAEVQLQDREAQVPAQVAVAEVWPRVESRERLHTDPRGRVKTRHSWFLVLSNSGDAPARDVYFSTEPDGSGPGDSWFARGEGEDKKYEILAPHDDMRFQIFASLSTAEQVRCTVHWTDDRGEQSNTATLRLV